MRTPLKPYTRAKTRMEGMKKPTEGWKENSPVLPKSSLISMRRIEG
jgi:hypothetical protein